MKITITSENLQKKLQIVQKAISSKNPLPILQNIHIKAEKSEIILSATDLEIGIQVTLPAQIEQEGETTVSAKLFSELINSLPNEKIELELEENNLKVRSKNTQSTFQTVSADEFPKLFEEMGQKIAVFTNKTLKKDLQSVIFSASLDVGRPALSGVLIKQDSDGGFLLVATDGYRLSLKKHTEEKTADSKEQQLLIPARILRETISVKEEKGETEVFLSQKQQQVIFKQGDLIIVGRLIEAPYPNYEKIIPSESSSQVAYDREELLKAIKICSIFARDSANIVKIAIAKDKIIVSANTPSVGKNSVEVEAKLSGEENEIAFNARYLLDFLSNIEEQNLVFEMNGPLNPGVFKIQGESSYLHIIMPIRVQV